MANKKEEILELPTLSEEDQRLIDAYVKTGVPVDQLAYTPAFDQLIQSLGRRDTIQEKYLVFQRLLNLRKRALLPRIYPIVT